jgi:PEP-CTERM motif
MKKQLITFAMSSVLAAASPSIWAAPVNLTVWTALGDTLVTATTATVTTAFTDENPVSGPMGSALDINLLEPRLMAAPGTLGLTAYEGSALMQSFVFTGSSTVRFNWTLGTENFDPAFADLAFALIDGSLLVPLANVSSTELTGLFSYTFGAGSHTLAFGVVDIGDYTGRSAFTVSGVDVTSAGAAVPEPGTAALLLLGLGSIGLLGRRRRG